MKGRFATVLLFMVCVSLSFGCGKTDRPMPLTKGNVTRYLQETETAVKSVTPEVVARAKGNEERQKQVMYDCFIAPMEKMGYSYGKTIDYLAVKVLSRKLPASDSATTVMLSNMLRFAVNLRDTEYKYGFITIETKDLLDKVSQILPR